MQIVRLFYYSPEVLDTIVYILNVTKVISAEEKFYRPSEFRWRGVISHWSYIADRDNRRKMEKLVYINERNDVLQSRDRLH